MSWFVTGVSVGFMAAVIFIASLSNERMSLSACRAAHPGFECNIGWVVGEAFK